MTKTYNKLQLSIKWNDGSVTNEPFKRVGVSAILKYFEKNSKICNDFQISTRRMTSVRNRFRVKNVKVFVKDANPAKIQIRRATISAPLNREVNDQAVNNNGKKIQARRMTIAEPLWFDNSLNENDSDDGVLDYAGNVDAENEAPLRPLNFNNVERIISLFKPKKVPFNYRRPSTH